jgi:hypothetical protein
MDMTNNAPEAIDEECVGFNLNTQKLHCLIVLDDRLGAALSNNAGEAFFRAFVVENRETGEVICNQRFRYKDGDSWMRMQLGPPHQHLDLEGRIAHFADGIGRVMRLGLKISAGGAEPPEESITYFYPPNPEDSQATYEWLVGQDLVEVRSIIRDGVETRVTKEGHA